MRPPLRTVADVAKLIAETIHQVRTGALDVKTANCVGFLAATLTRTFETSDIERRVDEFTALAAKSTAAQGGLRKVG